MAKYSTNVMDIGNKTPTFEFYEDGQEYIRNIFEHFTMFIHILHPVKYGVARHVSNTF